MADINKTIKDIEECLSASCRGYKPKVYCPHSDEEWDIMRDALELLKEQKKIVHCKDCRYNCWQQGHEIPSFWTPCREIKPEGHWFCWCGAAKDGD